MKAAGIGNLVWVSHPRFSPDGERIAYVVSHPDLPANTYRSSIYIVSIESGSVPDRLANFGERDDQPCWTLDGTSIIFVSTTEEDDKGDSVSSVVRRDLATSDVAVLMQSPEGFSAPTISPDGATLAIVTRTRGPHYDHEEASWRPPRKIDHLNFAENGEGFIIDRPQHVYVMAIDGSEPPRNLTPGSMSVSAPSWFPNAESLAVTVNRFRTDFAIDVGVLSVNGFDAESSAGELRLLTDGPGEYTAPAVSPDGGQVAAIGSDDVELFGHNPHLGVLDVTAVGIPKWLTHELDRTWGSYGIEQPPTWTAGGAIYAPVEDRGNVHLYATGHGRAAELVIGGEQSVTGWSVASATNGGTDSVAYTASTVTMPAELYLLADGEPRRITHHTDAFTGAVQLRPAQRFTARSSGTDGVDPVDVDAWLFTPPNFDPAKSYPALLNIHGGPFGQYGNTFFDEAQMQAEAGFVVLLSNPRGGSGRESAWGMAILGPKHKRPGSGWGGLDYQDVMAVVDAAVEQFPFIDESRLGVLGGSYGGYLTSWIVTHSNRFAAACSERAVNNLLSLEYASDFAGGFRVEVGVSHLDDPLEYLRMSPISYVDNIATPLLILHSEEDLRCPVDQATQLFVAAQLRGIPDVEYQLFPGEDHELSRNGSPVHRRQRSEIILEFFTRHLLPATRSA